jgi:hypothetical protein
VQTARLLDRKGDQIRHTAGVTGIRMLAQRLAADQLNLGHNRSHPSLFHVRQNNGGPKSREVAGNSGPYARSRSGNDCCLAVKGQLRDELLKTSKLPAVSYKLPCRTLTCISLDVAFRRDFLRLTQRQAECVSRSWHILNSVPVFLNSGLIYKISRSCAISRNATTLRRMLNYDLKGAKLAETANTPKSLGGSCQKPVALTSLATGSSQPFRKLKNADLPGRPLITGRSSGLRRFARDEIWVLLAGAEDTVVY